MEYYGEMKQYYASSFITHYNLERTNIKIHYLNGDTKLIPYDKENEELVLEKMKNQVDFLINCEEKYKYEAKSYGAIATLDSLVSILNIASLSLDHSEKKHVIIKLIVIGIWTFLAAHYGSDAIKAKRALEDIKKFKLFLENEELINQNMIDSYIEMYGDTAPISDANKMTVNDLDNYTLSELEEMIASIKDANQAKLELKA